MAAKEDAKDRHWLTFLYSLLSGIGFAAAMVIFALIIVALTNGSPFFPTESHDTFRWLFIAGMIGSMAAQTAVARFFKHSRVLKNVDLDLEGIEFWSNFLLVFLGIVSLVSMNNIYVHWPATIAYVSVVFVLDCYVVEKCKRHVSTNADAALLYRMCHVLKWKIDGISLVCLIGLSVAGSLIGASLAEEASVTLPYLGVVHFPEVFLSGVIGFHFVASTLLILGYLLDWREELDKLRNHHTAAQVTA